MYCLEIVICKSFFLCEEVYGKDFCGYNFDVNLLSYFIVRRMLYGDY